MGKKKRKTPPTIPGLIDSHCHLDYAPMSPDVEGALERAASAGVEQVLHIGCSPERLAPAIALAEAHANVFCSVGIHPHDGSAYTDAIEAELRRLSTHPKVLAIGETGLDYHYDFSPRDAQRESMARQVALAHEVDLPLVLHVRDAHDDALDVIDASKLPSRPGIVHCFTGTPDEARRWLDRGFHVSFSGIATFNSAQDVRDAVKLCPADRIMLETDAPFLAPVPMRGRKNEPAFVAFTCANLAELRGETPEALAEAATRNTRTLLAMPESAA